MKKNYKNSLVTAVCTVTVILMAARASAQNLFVSEQQEIDQVTPGGVSSLFAPGMNYPEGIAFNSAGDLFVGNSDLNSGESGNITEIAPNGMQSTFYSGIDPSGLAFNSAGDLFEADYGSGNIYEYTPAGAQSIFATGFFLPISLAFNSAGDLFVGSGTGNGGSSITEITPNGTQSTFATGLSLPAGLAFNSAGILFVSSQTSGTILEYSPSGTPSAFVTLSDSNLNGLAFDSAGNLYVATGQDDSIIKVTPGGTPSTFATGFNFPGGLAFQPVPEPSTWALLTAGMGLWLYRRRQVSGRA